MSKTIDKSLTKKLLDDVIVKDEPKVDVYKSTYPEPSYVQGGRSWMDDCDLGLGFVGLGFRGPLMVQSLTSAKSKFLSLSDVNWTQ